MIDKRIKVKSCERVIEFYNQGHTLEETGEKFNVSRQRIHQILKTKDIQTRPSLKYDVSLQEKKKIFARLLKDESPALIAAEYGIPSGTIYSWFQKLDWSLNGKKKENRETAILKLFEKDMTQKEIGDQIGISHNTVGNYLHRANIFPGKGNRTKRK